MSLISRHQIRATSLAHSSDRGGAFSSCFSAHSCGVGIITLFPFPVLTGVLGRRASPPLAMPYGAIVYVYVQGACYRHYVQTREATVDVDIDNQRGAGHGDRAPGRVPDVTGRPGRLSHCLVSSPVSARLRADTREA